MQYLDFRLVPQILVMSNPAQADIKDDTIPQELNPTCQTLYMYTITLLYQWEGSSIPTLVPLDINVNCKTPGFSLISQIWAMTNPIEADTEGDTIPHNLNSTL